MCREVPLAHVLGAIQEAGYDPGLAEVEGPEYPDLPPVCEECDTALVNGGVALFDDHSLDPEPVCHLCPEQGVSLLADLSTD